MVARQTNHVTLRLTLSGPSGGVGPAGPGGVFTEHSLHLHPDFTGLTGSESELTIHTAPASAPVQAHRKTTRDDTGYEQAETETETEGDERFVLVTYEILSVLGFTDRNRMSVLVRAPNGRIRLLTKGQC